MSATVVLLEERAALCDTFEKYGPEAPTLCEGWLTLDLAAHLAAREARSDAAVGLVLPGPFARHLEHVMDQYKDEGLRPARRPCCAPARRGCTARARSPTANVNENFVHHEDVRRANGEGQRTLDPEMDDILWRMLGLGSRLAQPPRQGCRADAAHPRRARARRGHRWPNRHADRSPGELALFMGGRKEAADVTLEGDPVAVAIVLAADFGV